MKLRLLPALCCLSLATLFSVPAAADPVVVTFDDLIGDNAIVPTGYGGIEWFSAWNHYGFAQPPYTPRSRPQRVYPRWYGQQLDSETFFEFIAPNQYFSGAWFAGHDTTYVQFHLYNDGSRVASSAILRPTGSPAFLSSGYGGLVDRVGVATDRLGFWVMDDVTYGGDVPVPEPATLLLLGGGLAGIVTARKRRAA